MIIIFIIFSNQQLGKVNIKRGIFQGDALSPLLFFVAMIPLTHVLRKIKSGYEFTKSKEKSTTYYTWTTSSYMRKMRRN